MKSVFIREQKRYTFHELQFSFNLDKDPLQKLLQRLKSFGILKNVKNSKEQQELSDLFEEDAELEELSSGGSESLYVFTFVGLVMIQNLVLKCYPKYIDKEEDLDIKLKEVIQVIEKADQKEQEILIYSEYDSSSSFNELALIMYLLTDYFEYGLYNVEDSIIEINGYGDINWDKTINDSFAIISNNRPYYPELVTRRKIHDESHFIKQLHEIILTKVTNTLQDANLHDLLGLPELLLAEEELDDLAEKDYILYQIEQQLSVEFNTRNQLLLKALYIYVDKKDTSSEKSDISFFGTNSFHVVWEKACAVAFENHLDHSLKSLGLGDSTQSLKEFLEKPKWTSKGIIQYSSKTLEPDTISIQDSLFMIFDAKYYLLKVEEKGLYNNPGIGDVTKQFLYQLAYKDFVSAQEKDLVVKNFFVMPTESETDLDFGSVTMEMFTGKPLELSPVYIIKLNVAEVYRAYLRESPLKGVIETLKGSSSV
ncbi:LlaJI family restriction endonuclease [Streptococcus mitis]|uniref:LlaJI restriction endonuclease n=1 Tax=Streptococcus mitis ATCC 6249 TaxID=864567 RepID=E0PRC1_STRMT|nr:LlaJI family restriction endonuclease [Streptococcus mitis]EFM31672.1 LlaJI restriction endonuclease [Streptococcus mitis ATCC 6249]